MIYASFINLGIKKRDEGAARLRMLFILPSFLLALLALSTKLEVGKMKSNCRSLIKPRVPSVASVCIHRIPTVNRASLWNSACFLAGLNHLEASHSCRLWFMPIEMQLICWKPPPYPTPPSSTSQARNCCCMPINYDNYLMQPQNDCRNKSKKKYNMKLKKDICS